MADINYGGEYGEGQPWDENIPRIQQELAKRAAPPDQAPANTPYEEGGIRGPARGGLETKPEPTDTNTPPPTDYTKMGQFANSFGAWNGNEKFNRGWDDKSERYKMLTVMSHFDPRQGITPELINALNSANIQGAKFSGSGDKLNVDNAGNWARFGKGGTADVIQGFKTGNGTWSPWQMDEGGGNAGGPTGGGYAGPSAMAELLRRRYAGYPEQYPDNQFMNGSLENPVQFGNKPLYTQNPLYQEMMKRLLFTPKQ